MLLIDKAIKAAIDKSSESIIFNNTYVKCFFYERIELDDFYVVVLENDIKIFQEEDFNYYIKINISQVIAAARCTFSSLSSGIIDLIIDYDSLIEKKLIVIPIEIEPNRSKFAYSNRVTCISLNLYDKTVNESDNNFIHLSKEQLEKEIEKAELGDELSQLFIAKVYFNGRMGVDKNIEKAYFFVSKLLKSKNKYGQFLKYLIDLDRYFGSQEWNVNKLQEIINLLEASAELGLTDSKLNLAALYLSGKLIEKDLAKGLHWLESAAKDDCYLAYSSIGLIYYRGELGSPDYKKAFECFKKAANEGDAFSQYALGNMYASGHHVEKNVKSAVFWYKKSASKGYNDALLILKKINRLGLKFNS